MTLTDALRRAAQDAAATLGLALGFEGEPFTVPAQAHLRCKLASGSARAAALGAGAPLRVDGALEISAVTLQGVAGQGETEAARIAAQVAALFPLGRGVDIDGPEGRGEAVFSAPRTESASTDGGRVRLTVSMSFYAIIFPSIGG